MDEETTQKMKQVCRFEILFPVESDEQALAIRRAISEVVKDVKNKRFTFQIIET